MTAEEFSDHLYSVSAKPITYRKLHQAIEWAEEIRGWSEDVQDETLGIWGGPMDRYSDDQVGNMALSLRVFYFRCDRTADREDLYILPGGRMWGTTEIGIVFEEPSCLAIQYVLEEVRPHGAYSRRVCPVRRRPGAVYSSAAYQVFPDELRARESFNHGFRESIWSDELFEFLEIKINGNAKGRRCQCHNAIHHHARHHWLEENRCSGTTWSSRVGVRSVYQTKHVKVKTM